MAAGLAPISSDFDGYKDTVPPDAGIRVKTPWHADHSFLSELRPLLHERPLHLLLGQTVEVDLGELEEAIVALAADDCRRVDLSRRAIAHGARLRLARVVAAYNRSGGASRPCLARCQPPLTAASRRWP